MITAQGPEGRAARLGLQHFRVIRREDFGRDLLVDAAGGGAEAFVQEGMDRLSRRQRRLGHIDARQGQRQGVGDAEAVDDQPGPVDVAADALDLGLAQAAFLLGKQLEPRSVGVLK